MERRDFEGIFNVEGKPPDALVRLCREYLLYGDKVAKKSKHQTEHLEGAFAVHILPFFGPNTSIKDITKDKIEEYIAYLVDCGLKPKSCKHYYGDLKALFNWVIERDDQLIEKNPCNRIKSKAIKHRYVKPPIDTGAYDQASACLPRDEKVWFDFMRYTGYRKDEANRLTWDDLFLDQGEMIVPGTKTDRSYARLPIAPVVIDALRIHKTLSDPRCKLVFPDKTGKYIYDRKWIFDIIANRTGVRLDTRQLRYYFCVKTMEHVTNPGVAKDLMRHTTLATTDLYLQHRVDLQKEAVRDIGK